VGRGFGNRAVGRDYVRKGVIGRKVWVLDGRHQVEVGRMEVTSN